MFENCFLALSLVDLGDKRFLCFMRPKDFKFDLDCNQVSVTFEGSLAKINSINIPKRVDD